MVERSPGIKFVPRWVLDRGYSFVVGLRTGYSGPKLTLVKCSGSCRIGSGCKGQEPLANCTAAADWVCEMCIGSGLVGSDFDGTICGGLVLLVGALCDSSMHGVGRGHCLGRVNLGRDETGENLVPRPGRLGFAATFVVPARCIGTEGGGLMAVDVREPVTTTLTGIPTGRRLSEIASPKSSSWSGS
jgi:hypothetical protein